MLKTRQLRVFGERIFRLSKPKSLTWKETDILFMNHTAEGRKLPKRKIFESWEWKTSYIESQLRTLKKRKYEFETAVFFRECVAPQTPKL